MNKQPLISKGQVPYVIAFVAILFLVLVGPETLAFSFLLAWLFIPWKEYILKFKHYMDKLEKEASNAS